MKKKIIYFLLIVSAILLQLSFLPIVFGGNALGDVVLMLVLAFAVTEGFAEILSWAIFAGVAYDLASYSRLGEHVIVFLLVVYGVSFFSRRLSVDVRGTGFLLLLLFVVFATLLSKYLLLSFAGLESGGIFSANGFSRILDSIVFQVGFNVLIFSLWFIVLKRIKKTL